MLSCFPTDALLWALSCPGWQETAHYLPLFVNISQAANCLQRRNDPKPSRALCPSGLDVLCWGCWGSWGRVWAQNHSHPCRAAPSSWDGDGEAFTPPLQQVSNRSPQHSAQMNSPHDEFGLSPLSVAITQEGVSCYNLSDVLVHSTVPMFFQH